MILKIETNDFDFKKTFNSGLFYFFYEKEPTKEIYFNNEFLDLEFEQKEKILLVKITGVLRKKKELTKRIKYCLGLDENLEVFYKICEKDIVLKNHLNKIKGTRIISAFSDFEALVGAIVSQNNSYKNYRKKMLEICRKLNFVPENFTKENLVDLGLGYKLPYLINLAKNFDGDLDEIKGIGPYSKNLFEIFQKRNYDAFYIDCLTEKIMSEKYKINGNMEEASRKLWGEYRGLAEAYLQRFFEVK